MASFDILIVGAGIAGCALAHGLSQIPREKPLRIGLVERSLSEPDRIVGELLQPGGRMALETLGLEWCTEDIDAIPTNGYCVVEGGKAVHIPYPGVHEGRCFHHGRFIMKLRDAARQAPGVELIEGTVTQLIENDATKKIHGVRIVKKDIEEVKETLYADLVIIADGCFSNFRNQVMGAASVAPVTKSHFIGLVLEDVTLPIPNHGTVCLTKGFGPVLLYQISKHDTRMLVDVKAPLPADLKSHILKNITPQLPSSLHTAIETALDKDRLRRMPNSFLPPIEQGSRQSKAGALLIGDSWNMRHPLTGGGMTVALNDVVLLRDLLANVDDFKDWPQVRKALKKWYWDRKGLSSTVNILSVALYDLFGADDEELQVLRTGCFKYFERGGECINGPVSLLSGIAPSPWLLAWHFFSVAFYSIYIMFRDPSPSSGKQPPAEAPGIMEYPALCLKGMRVFWTACIVFGPLLWSELRWWSPSDTSTRNQLVVTSLAPLVLLYLASNYGVPSLGKIGLLVG